MILSGRKEDVTDVDKNNDNEAVMIERGRMNWKEFIEMMPGK